MWIASLVLVVVAGSMPFLLSACASGRIRRNPFAGLRVRWIMVDEQTWEAGHRAALPTTWVVAALTVVLAAISALPSLSQSTAVAFSLSAAGVLIIGVIVMALIGNRAALEVIASREPGPASQPTP